MLFFSRLSDSIVEYPHRWALATLFLALALGALDARNLVKAQFGVAQSEGAKTRELADRHARQVEQDLRLRLDALAGHAEAQLATTRTETLAEVRALRAAADRRTGDALALVDTRTGQALDQVAGMRADLKPALGHLTEASAQLETASRELPGVLRDGRFLLARGARTAGHIEQMSDRIEAAVPQLLGGVDRIVTNSDATTLQTAQLMKHLSDATKPLPTWARIGLAVAPPVVQTGFTIGSWMAVKGK